jgi:cytochrome c peroxidase
MGKFRVPTLRNVALTAPYMHDGSLARLQDVIDHYARGGRKNPHQDSRVRPLSLSQAERADLVAFLESLTDREFVEDPRFR